MPPPQPRLISRKTLIILSVIADALDVFLLLGVAPGPWSIVIDVPITVIHFMYAGPMAVFVLAEYIPFAGFLPIYTVAALLYRDSPRQLAQADVAPAPFPSHPPAHPQSHVQRFLAPPPVPVAGQDFPQRTDVHERLRKLAELLNQKLISQADYEAMKQRILNEL